MGLLYFCALRIDDEMVINIQYVADGDRFVLFSDLGPPAAGEQAYPGMPRANLFWRSTLGATLSLTGEHPPHVVIALETPWRTLDAAQLEKVLEGFMNTVEEWSVELADPDVGDDETAAGQCGPRAGPGMIWG